MLHVYICCWAEKVTEDNTPKSETETECWNFYSHAMCCHFSVFSNLCTLYTVNAGGELLPKIELKIARCNYLAGNRICISCAREKATEMPWKCVVVFLFNKQLSKRNWQRSEVIYANQNKCKREHDKTNAICIAIGLRLISLHVQNVTEITLPLSGVYIFVGRRRECTAVHAVGLTTVFFCSTRPTDRTRVPL